MAKIIHTFFPLLLLVGASHVATAQTQCWVANNETGELAFQGVTEGRGFEGQFNAFDVRLCLEGQDLSTASIEVTVETGSADTNSRDRDQTLKGEAFFWVSQFPEATWTSTQILPIDGEFSHQAQGRLSLRDVAMDQPVHMRLVGEGNGLRLVGQASILRLDYNVGMGEFEDTDFIENQVDLRFDLGLNPDN